MIFSRQRSFADVRGDVDDLCKRLQAFDVHYLMTMDGTAMELQDQGRPQGAANQDL